MQQAPSGPPSQGPQTQLAWSRCSQRRVGGGCGHVELPAGLPPLQALWAAGGQLLNLGQLLLLSGTLLRPAAMA